jgi:hypothetical protein
MWPSASYTLAWIQARKAKKNGPPERPNGLNGEHSAIWGFLLHLNSRVDTLHTLFLSATIAGLVLLVGILVTVLVK